MTGCRAKDQVDARDIGAICRVSCPGAADSQSQEFTLGRGRAVVVRVRENGDVYVYGFTSRREKPRLRVTGLRLQERP